jgi:hypothetical protein
MAPAESPEIADPRYLSSNQYRRGRRKSGVPSRKGFLRTIAAVHHQRIQAVVASLDRHIVRRNPPPTML